jgi:hypothetical protein
MHFIGAIDLPVKNIPVVCNGNIQRAAAVYREVNDQCIKKKNDQRQ